MISAWIFALATVCTAAPDADVDAFLKEFSAKRDGVVALDAAFTQKTKLPDEELTTKGSLIFIKPRRIIFHTDDPERTTLVDDRSGYEYDPEIKQLQIFDIEDNPQADIFFLGFNSNTETLREAYDLTLFDIPNDPRGKHGIKIKPKAQSKEQAYFIEVNLYLRDEDYLPYRIHIRNDEESEVSIEVESINKTFRPTPQLTQIFLPQDTKVVQNDRVVETVEAGGKRVPDAILMPPEPAALLPNEENMAPPEATSVALPPPPPLPAPAAKPETEPAPEPAPAATTETPPAPAPEKKLGLSPAPATKAAPKAQAKPQGGKKQPATGTVKKSTPETAKKPAATAAKKSTSKASAAKKADTKKTGTAKADAKPADDGKAQGTP